MSREPLFLICRPVEFTVADTVAAGTYPVTITGTAGANTHSTTLQLNVNPPPSPWTQTTIQAPGRAEYSSGVYTMIAGSGSNSNWQEENHYVNQGLTADGSLVVRIAGMSYEPVGFSPTAYAGVMIRDSNNVNANRMFLKLRGDIGLELETKPSGGSLVITPIAAVTAPVWLKIVRQTGNVASFYSQDGITWTQAGTSIALTSATVGFAGGTGVFGGIAEILFDNVSVSTAPDFFLTATPASQNAIPGEQKAYTVNVSALAGFNSSVSLSIPPASLPAGTTASFNPPSITGAGQSTLTVTTSGSTPQGSFVLPITGTSGGTSRIVTVSVVTSPDFTLSVSPAAQTSNISTSTSYTVTVNFANGLTTPVTLSAENLPTGVGATFTPSSLSATGTSTLALTIGPNTPQRTYPFTIVGKSGALLHTITATLVIGASDYSVTLDSPAITFPPTGGTGTRTITITPVNNFSKTVTLSATNLPQGVTASFSPTAIAPGTPSTLTITAPAGLAVGTYAMSIVGTLIDQAAGNSVRSTTLQLVISPTGNLPSGWSSQDIGTVGLAGSTGYSASTFTVQAAGIDPGGFSDALRYTYVPWSGDGTIVVQVARTQNTTGSSEFGVMFRETLDPSSRLAVVAIQGGNASLGTRTTFGGGIGYFTSFGAAVPTWLKLQRQSSTFICSTSIDGNTWSPCGSSGVTMASNAYVGFYASSGNTASIATLDFYGASVVGPAVDFYLTPYPSGQTLPSGGAAIYQTVRLQSAYGFAGTADLSVSGLPAGATYALSSSSIAAGGFANVQINLPASLAPGPYTATITATSGSITHSVQLTMTVSPSVPLPQPWNASDIGSPRIPGSTSFAADGSVTMISLSSAIEGTSEKFRYTYQSLVGDGAMVLRVTNAGGIWDHRRTGIMVRETLEPDSPNVFAHTFAWFDFGPSGTNADLQYRATKGGGTTQIGGPAISTPTTSTPYWLKLIRQGNQFTGFGSTDGASWVQIGTASVTMAQRVFVGIAVGANQDALTTFTFDNGTWLSSPNASPDFWVFAYPSTHALGSAGGNVYYTAEVGALNGFTGSVGLSVINLPAGASASTATVNSGGAAALKVTAPSLAALPYPMTINGVSGALTRSAPVSLNITSPGFSLLPDPWAHMDIGTVGFPGDATHSNGSYTVSGSGSVTYFQADNFHYAYQPISGDATLIARVASTQNQTGTAKTGIMIRENLTSPSANAMVEMTAIDTVFQWRQTPGGDSSYIDPTSPKKSWLKLVRSGNQFTGFNSNDGIAWSQVGTASVPMRSSVYAGLAVTAENNNALTTGTFDNLLVSNIPDFRLIPAQTNRYVGPSSSAQFTLNVDPMNGFAGPLNFTLSGNPTGVSGSFSPNPWNGSGLVTLTLATNSSVTPGTTRITIQLVTRIANSRSLARPTTL